MGMTFDIPCSIYMDQGISRGIGDMLLDEGKKRTLLICDGNLYEMGIIDPIAESIRKVGNKVVIFDGVRGEPSYKLVEEAAAIAQEENIDSIVGVGGGSVLDTAKCVMIMNANGHILEYADTFGGVPAKGVFLTLIPTTFGTGSEVTNGAVIFMPEKGRKVTIWGKNTGADMALIDPELAIRIPPSITASTGMDALAHAVEAYTSPMASPMSDIFALEAIRLIEEYLPKCVTDGSNNENREKMCLGALFAGIAFNNGGLNQGHELAHALGAKFHIPHGTACALTLPLAIKANAEYMPDRIKILAEMFSVNYGIDETKDIEKIGELISESLVEMRKDLGIPDLGTFGIDEESYHLVGDAWDAEPKGTYRFNPDREYIIEFIKSIC